MNAGSHFGDTFLAFGIIHHIHGSLKSSEVQPATSRPVLLSSKEQYSCYFIDLPHLTPSMLLLETSTHA
jgi:hypothetical protein